MSELPATTAYPGDERVNVGSVRQLASRHNLANAGRAEIISFKSHTCPGGPSKIGAVVTKRSVTKDGIWRSKCWRGHMKSQLCLPSVPSCSL